MAQHTRLRRTEQGVGQVVVDFAVFQLREEGTDRRWPRVALAEEPQGTSLQHELGLRSMVVRHDEHGRPIELHALTPVAARHHGMCANLAARTRSMTFLFSGNVSLLSQLRICRGGW